MQFIQATVYILNFFCINAPTHTQDASVADIFHTKNARPSVGQDQHAETWH